MNIGEEIGPSRGTKLCKDPEVENQFGGILEQPNCCMQGFNFSVPQFPYM